MNLRFRLNLIVTLVLVIILAISAIQTVNIARENVRAESTSAMAFAIHMLTAELPHISKTEKTALQQPARFKLNQLANVRHLLIAFHDLDNNLIESNKPIPQQENQTTPNWFKNLMFTALGNIPETRLPVYTNKTKIGELVVSPEPNSEITEAWAETKTLLLMITLIFLVVNIMVYLVVANALRPVTHITKALSDIEAGRLETRLPVFKLPELAIISQRFNTMAATMQNSILHNQRLTQRIIRLQETERKSLAQELHDEIGQHLTAIHVDASVIKESTDHTSSTKSAQAIDENALHMMAILRSMLKRLRPGGLDELSFVDAIQELIESWHERHTQITLDYKIQDNFNLSDEAIQLTLYRVLQECLTNISRHSRATRVSIDLHTSRTDYSLEVTDNGRGFDVDEQRSSFGISGMQQRVESVAGKMVIEAKQNIGVGIRISIPRLGEVT
ncbi:MAG: histidine kinase [Candidatus Thiodiazotropha sp.]